MDRAGQARAAVAEGEGALMGNMGHTKGWGNRQYVRQAREFICNHCGEPFLSKASKVFDCPNCREIARREYADELLAQKRRDTKAKANQKMWISYQYEVLSDPDECAGLSQGARFAGHDMSYTLSMGHFTPGTRILDRKAGVELTVIGRLGQQQILARAVSETGVRA